MNVQKFAKDLNEWPDGYADDVRASKALLQELEGKAGSDVTSFSSPLNYFGVKRRNLFVIRLHPKYSVNFDVVAYPRVEHFGEFLKMQNPRRNLLAIGGHFAHYPGSIGALECRVHANKWIIAFVQGHYKFKPVRTKKQIVETYINFIKRPGVSSETKKLAGYTLSKILKREIGLDRKMFRKNYADWRVHVFQVAMEHAVEKRATLVFDLNRYMPQIEPSLNLPKLRTPTTQLEADFKKACTRAGVHFEKTGKVLTARPKA